MMMYITVGRSRGSPHHHTGKLGNGGKQRTLGAKPDKIGRAAGEDTAARQNIKDTIGAIRA